MDITVDNLYCFATSGLQESVIIPVSGSARLIHIQATIDEEPDTDIEIPLGFLHEISVLKIVVESCHLT
jgi:hypothetical protein